jgi:hypothetical protein
MATGSVYHKLQCSPNLLLRQMILLPTLHYYHPCSLLLLQRMLQLLEGLLADFIQSHTGNRCDSRSLLPAAQCVQPCIGPQEKWDEHGVFVRHQWEWGVHLPCNCQPDSTAPFSCMRQLEAEPAHTCAPLTRDCCHSAVSCRVMAKPQVRPG